MSGIAGTSLRLCQTTMAASLYGEYEQTEDGRSTCEGILIVDRHIPIPIREPQRHHGFDGVGVDDSYRRLLATLWRHARRRKPDVRRESEPPRDKLPYTDSLIWEIEQYAILPGSLATAYGQFLPPLEIVLGAFLVLGIWLKVSSSLGGLLVLSFIIAKIAAFARGLDIEICPCFGPAVPLLAVHSLAIDFVLLALALQLLLHRTEFLSVDALFLGKAKSSSER